MEQFNNLIEFRQVVFEHGFTKASDAQFELVDALLLGRPIRSFPELSLLPTFRRKWHSSYAAIERGGQDWGWLEWHFIQQIPTQGPKLFSLDGTAWPHPAAWTLADRQYVFSPTRAVNGGSIVVGHPYSVLAWVPESGSSWGLPVSIRRALSQQTDVEVGIEQVKHLCRHRREEMLEDLYLIIADAKYGNHLSWPNNTSVRETGMIAPQNETIADSLRTDGIFTPYGHPMARTVRRVDGVEVGDHHRR